MPPKPKLRTYREPMMPAGELHPVVKAYLLEGTYPPLNAPDEVRDIPFEPARAERLWKAHKRELLAEGKRKGYSPFAVDLFEDKPLAGLQAWRRHEPDPRPILRGGRVKACPHCGRSGFDVKACLS